MGFYDWLAGFATGESWFTLKVVNGGTTISPVWGINLRDDDACILEDIVLELGFGNIYNRHQTYEGTGRNGNPQACFQVTNVPDCVKVVDIFREHRLAGKKAQVFEVWAKAIDHMALYYRRHRKLYSDHYDLDYLLSLKAEITELVEYRALVAV